MDSSFSAKGDEFIQKGDKAYKGITKITLKRINFWKYFWK